MFGLYFHALAEHRHHKRHPDEPSLTHAWLQRMQDFLPGVSRGEARQFVQSWLLARRPGGCTPAAAHADISCAGLGCGSRAVKLHACSRWPCLFSLLTFSNHPLLLLQDNQRLAKLQAWLEERHVEMRGLGDWLRSHLHLPEGGALHITLPNIQLGALLCYLFFRQLHSVICGTPGCLPAAPGCEATPRPCLLRSAAGGGDGAARLQAALASGGERMKVRDNIVLSTCSKPSILCPLYVVVGCVLPPLRPIPTSLAPVTMRPCWLHVQLAHPHPPFPGHHGRVCRRWRRPGQPGQGPCLLPGTLAGWCAACMLGWRAGWLCGQV